MYHSEIRPASLVDKAEFPGILLTEKQPLIYFSHTLHQDNYYMNTAAIDAIFTENYLQELFPSERSNEFFDALFGDASEGAYDISLAYRGTDGKTITLELELTERPGHCLACNLTQGLPTVFSRHPIINVNGVVKDVEKSLNGLASCKEWSLGYTQQKSSGLHAIPLTITLDS